MNNCLLSGFERNREKVKEKEERWLTKNSNYLLKNKLNFQIGLIYK